MHVNRRRDWRTRHTHTLRIERTGFSYDPECKFGSWVTTSCGEYRAAYDYMRAVSGDEYAGLRAALDDLRR